MITHSAYGRSTFKLFRRVHNEYDFLLRDIDRQPVELAGDLTFHIWDNEGNPVISTPMVVHNAPRGHYKTIINEEQTSYIRGGIYVWGVTHEDGSATKLLYTNQDYGANGIVEVLDGIPTPVIESQTIYPEDMTPLDGMLYSSSLQGETSENPAGNHTIAVYVEDFTGRLIVEATTDSDIPQNETGWFDVMDIEYDHATGVIPANFQGNFTYVRIWITDTEGLTKISYRN